MSMGMQHPGFGKRAPAIGKTSCVTRSKKTTMDHSHRDYNKGRKSGAPSGSAMDKSAAAAGNSGERRK